MLQSTKTRLGPYTPALDAYRMIEREGESLDAVQRRLRHATILTTQREYSHFDRV